ncbi:MAG TPA: TIGR03808 family TAT-translocated repetitive protein, partial [Hyphomicrobiaceae bacterium]|nr:TIGR03808 family TAT-translocated repetitive protein [Hyphomicrobiaceae bacterium]
EDQLRNYWYADEMTRPSGGRDFKFDGLLYSNNSIFNILRSMERHYSNTKGKMTIRGGVIAADNRITDCAYSAVRANAAADVQIVTNNVARVGEVALYAEFAFSGAVISGNIVDGAAAGISVTNFNEGGRLAVVEGNLIRNLARREHEPVDKRGEGIAVEADATVVGNVIEAGIVVGWGRYMRDCVVSGNVVRASRVGIAITADGEAGACLVHGNLVSGASEGGVRAMRLGVLFGPDLTRQASESRRVVVAANVTA